MKKCRYVRVPCEIPSRPQTIEAGSAASAAAVASDISEGGFRFRSNAFLGVRRRLRFKLEISGSPSLAAVEPVWIREVPSSGQYEIGGRFLTLSENDRNLVRGFVHSTRR